MDKACPVVIQHKAGPELLAFRHPHAGLQIVKGTIEPGEALRQACERELFEESGVKATAGRYLGKLTMADGLVWGFVQMQGVAALPSTWSYHTRDGGGLTFNFFWHPLHGRTGSEWDSRYVAAIRLLRRFF